MSKRNQHVVPHQGGWAVLGAGADRATAVHKTQSAAIEQARSIARHQGTELLIHGTDGRIPDRDPTATTPIPQRAETMTQIEGAVIREQGVTFAIVIVRPSVIQNTIEASQAIQSFEPIFPGMPVVLMAQDSRGTPTYYGRRDLSQFMSRVPLQAVPWKRYTIN